ncbi:hypothetical protein DFH06DRAFT_1119432 [Mycena polygramma]|nr:hypothetical protein DFH06DRAFT_1119432 [Mycena polygramma]
MSRIGTAKRYRRPRHHISSSGEQPPASLKKAAGRHTPPASAKETIPRRRREAAPIASTRRIELPRAASQSQVDSVSLILLVANLPFNRALFSQKKSRRQADGVYTCNSTVFVLWRVLLATWAPRSGAHSFETTYRNPASGVTSLRKKPPAGRRPLQLQFDGTRASSAWRGRCATPKPYIAFPRGVDFLSQRPVILCGLDAL